MNIVDSFKLRFIIDQSISCFRFLNFVKVQDDISSQLAGFQISKLLKSQENNQLKFAQLVKKRAALTQITQKKQLELVQAQIANLSMILKESTKKLCKLFKQNPDLQRDSLKVSRQRRMLIIKLEQLIQFIKSNSTAKFQSFVTHELQSQDQMRRLMQKQKNLNIEIKRIQQEKLAQSKQYNKQILQSQSRIQEFKENLIDKKKKAELEINYFEKENKAEISNKKRLNQQSQKALSVEIENLRSSIKTQTLVHKQLEDYLNRKNADIKKKSEQLTAKTQECKDQFDQEINELNETIDKTSQQLEVFKGKYKIEQANKYERQKKQRNKILQKQLKQQNLIKLHNAIKYIQNQYLLWKDAGGGKKKKKKIPPKKK